jgi:hypothetical protein
MMLQLWQMTAVANNNGSCISTYQWMQTMMPWLWQTMMAANDNVGK